MKCYIAGKITGLPESDYRADFERGKNIVSQLGMQPVSPLDLPHDHAPVWHLYMREDIAALVQCDVIFMLSSWVDSRGARLEYTLAHSLQLVVLHENELEAAKQTLGFQ